MCILRHLSMSFNDKAQGAPHEYNPVKKGPVTRFVHGETEAQEMKTLLWGLVCYSLYL